MAAWPDGIMAAKKRPVQKNTQTANDTRNTTTKQRKKPAAHLSSTCRYLDYVTTLLWLRRHETAAGVEPLLVGGHDLLLLVGVGVHQLQTLFLISRANDRQETEKSKHTHTHTHTQPVILYSPVNASPAPNNITQNFFLKNIDKRYEASKR